MTSCIYVCSAGHSGSTLLDLLLGAHSRAQSLGEISHLPKNVALNTDCSCGRAIRGCPVWHDVLRVMSSRIGLNIEVNPYAIDLGYPKATDVIDRSHQTRAYLLRRRLVLGLAYARYSLGVELPSVFIKSFQRSVDLNFLLYDIVGEVCGVDLVVDSCKSYL
jgi:hypothetical protein